MNPGIRETASLILATLRTVINTILPTGATAQARDSGARARERGNVVSVTVLTLLISLVNAIGVLLVNGKVDGLTGRVDHLTDRVDDLTGKVDHLTGRVDHLTDGVDHLTGRVDRLTGRVDALQAVITADINADARP